VRVKDARKQQQIAKRQAEVRRLHQDAQWAAVVRVGQLLHTLDPDAADPEGLVTSARAELAAAKEKRAQAYKPPVTRIRASAVDVPGLAEALRLWYENQDLEAIVIATSPSAAYTVQCRKRRTSNSASERKALLTVILHSEGEDLVVEIGAPSHKGMAAAGVIYFPLLAVAGVAVARRDNLINETISFLRETAPTHLRGAR
jgi:hypothetical protein